MIRARDLRKRMTDAEIRLWGEIRPKQIGGVRFRKQAPIGRYIVDFVAHDVGLIIEVDGGQHNDPVQMQYDNERTDWLNSQGYKTLRFWNHEVLLELDAVLEVIWDVCTKSTPHPRLPPQGGKEFLNK